MAIWLDASDVATWLKVTSPTAEQWTRIELCTDAAAGWVERQRPDLWDRTDPDYPVFVSDSRTVMAAILSAARLYARVDSPNGVVAFDELGAGSILSKDPDVARLLGRPRARVG